MLLLAAVAQSYCLEILCPHWLRLLVTWSWYSPLIGWDAWGSDQLFSRESETGRSEGGSGGPVVILTPARSPPSVCQCQPNCYPQCPAQLSSASPHQPQSPSAPQFTHISDCSADVGEWSCLLQFHVHSSACFRVAAAASSQQPGLVEVQKKWKLLPNLFITTWKLTSWGGGVAPDWSIMLTLLILSLVSAQWSLHGNYMFGSNQTNRHRHQHTIHKEISVTCLFLFQRKDWKK